MNKDQLVIVIKNAVASILHSKDLQPNYLSEDTEIFGAGSQIDSLGHRTGHHRKHRKADYLSR